MSSKPQILLHACCAPCSTLPVSRLQIEYDVVLYFFNPNIYPLSEYRLREEEIVRYARQLQLPVKTGDNDFWEFEAAIAGMEHLGEATDRCWACYRLRLESTARMCKQCGIPGFTTTLSLSPHKKVKQIHAIGHKLAKRYGITFLDDDFKKKDGFAISSRMSRDAGMYRQEYCGCRYSLEEMRRRKNMERAR